MKSLCLPYIIIYFYFNVMPKNAHLINYFYSHSIRSSYKFYSEYTLNIHKRLWVTTFLSPYLVNLKAQFRTLFCNNLSIFITCTLHEIISSYHWITNHVVMQIHRYYWFVLTFPSSVIFSTKTSIWIDALLLYMFWTKINILCCVSCFYGPWKVAFI